MTGKVLVSLMLAFLVVSSSVFLPSLFFFATPKTFYNAAFGSFDPRAFLVDVLAWGVLIFIGLILFEVGLVWAKRVFLAGLITPLLMAAVSLYLKDVPLYLLVSVSFLGAFFLSTLFLPEKRL